MKVEIDNGRCTGHGRCYALSPSVFSDDDAGYGQVRSDVELTEALRADAKRAADACPEQAIRISD